MKKSNIYTRTGDTGMTSLVGGQRAPKNSPRLEAYGTVDELNSSLGLLIAMLPASTNDADPELAPLLQTIQNRLFDIGGYLACDPAGDFRLPPGATPADIEHLEHAIDRLDSQLPRHNRFILPGGTLAAAQAQVARTVCRRAERRILALAELSPLDPAVIRYVNRLSDLLFVIARWINKIANLQEIFWQQK